MSKQIINQNVLWSDKMRHCGLPLSFTKYILDDSRLYISRGLFTTNTDEILLYRILDLKTRRTLWQKIFGVGTIILYSADQSDRILELKNIKHPLETHRYISDLVEQRRIERGAAGQEMMGISGMHGYCTNAHDCDGSTFGNID